MNLIEAYLKANVGDKIGLGTQETAYLIKIKEGSIRELKDFITEMLTESEVLSNNWIVMKKQKGCLYCQELVDACYRIKLEVEEQQRQGGPVGQQTWRFYNLVNHALKKYDNSRSI